MIPSMLPADRANPIVVKSNLTTGRSATPVDVSTSVFATGRNPRRLARDWLIAL